MARFRKFRTSDSTNHEHFQGRHCFVRWYCDNQIYFITARCRDRYPAFRTEEAKLIFWDRFEHYTKLHTFTPIVTSLLDNHYHTLGHLKVGQELGEMMRKLHGSVAKLVNDILPERKVPFWRDRESKNYFGGCLRDELQLRWTFKYTYTQCRRQGICTDPALYPHTRVNVDLDRALRRALQLGAFLEHLPYPRYQRNKR